MRKKRLFILASVPLVLALLAGAGFLLGDELGEAGGGPCVEEEKGFFCLGDLPTPACQYDETGLPLPGGDPMCAGIAQCETCPVPTFPPPTFIEIIRDNPGAILTGPPTHRVGDAAALGRSDCQPGWQAVVSDASGMSVCFPGDVGKLTASGYRETADRWEDRIELTLAGDSLPAVVTMNIARSAGLSSYSLSLDCDNPDFAPVLDLPARTCVWPQGKDERYESAVPIFISSHLIEKNGFQWVFEAIAWGLAAESRQDTSSLQTTISQILSSLRLP